MEDAQQLKLQKKSLTKDLYIQKKLSELNKKEEGENGYVVSLLIFP
jgi:hypothetical protein